MPFRPQLEELGTRILPSVTTLPLLAPSQLSVVAASQQLTLAGGGTYTAPGIQSGAGLQYSLQGDGHAAGLGMVTIEGNLHAVGFIQHGKAGGTLTFTNGEGSLTVSLQGPVQDAFAPLPTIFHYTITGGTGVYKHATGSGSLDLTLSPPTPTSVGSLSGTFGLEIPASPRPGPFSGNYTSGRYIPDVPVTKHLNGKVVLGSLGSFDLTGTFTSGGFVVHPQNWIDYGQFTLKNSKGSLTLSIQGDVTSQGLYYFTVTKGTGLYAHTRAQGWFNLAFTPDNTSITSGKFSIQTISLTIEPTPSGTHS